MSDVGCRTEKSYFLRVIAKESTYMGHDRGEYRCPLDPAKVGTRKVFTDFAKKSITSRLILILTANSFASCIIVVVGTLRGHTFAGEMSISTFQHPTVVKPWTAAVLTPHSPTISSCFIILVESRARNFKDHMMHICHAPFDCEA